MTEFFQKTIRYSFYTLVFLVPLVFTNSNSELFELNKMWLTWGLALIIFFAWTSKMLLDRQFRVQRTFFDIPLLLFLLSQIISTFISMDPRTSLWGYYSRFNGGLYSTITYIFLYYAFVTNFSKEQVLTFLKVGIISCLVTVVWGIPSHFGYDPTCLLFRGTLDVECWTEGFKPTVRIFSTLGQPAWMAAYVNMFIPLVVSLLLTSALTLKNEKKNLWIGIYGLLTILFYMAEVYTNTRAGFIAFWIGNAAFWVVMLLRGHLKDKLMLTFFLSIQAAYLVITFFSTTPLPQVNRFTLSGLSQATSVQPSTPTPSATPAAAPVMTGATDSAVIRLYVWKGALDIWKAHPLFGTGVETFAYAYYQYRPVEHNLTSEWDYLYNKAHNEYLNYLATTGAFGLGTYLLLIILVLFWAGKYLFFDKKEDKPTYLLILALITGYGTILITNFFGFSVVIVNIYFFLIPASMLLLTNSLSSKSLLFGKESSLAGGSKQWIGITFIGIIVLGFLIMLIRFWDADKKYALAHNFYLTGQMEYAQQSYALLQEAYGLWPSEPVILDELSQNSTSLALAFYSQNDATSAAQFTKQAVDLSDEIVANYPANVVFWKNRVRILYSLSQADPQYLPKAIAAIEKAYTLAPTDAKIMYNLGVLYGQTGKLDEGIKILEKTIQYRPMYRDARYALALFYRQKATNNGEIVLYPEDEKKAVDQLYYILNNLSIDDKPSLQLLEIWKEPVPEASSK